MKKILHFKKHKDCNIHCEGCISSTQGILKKESIQISDSPKIFNHLNVLNNITNKNEKVSYSISFLGGEPLIDTSDYSFYKDMILNFNHQIADYGVQTNLIFDDSVLNELLADKKMWSGKVGTSYNFNKTRMLNKSHKEFKAEFLKNYNTFSENFDYNLPIIVVVTPNNVKDIFKIYEFLNSKDIDVTFFHFLPMGKKTKYSSYFKDDNFHQNFSSKLIKISEDPNKKIRVHPIDKIDDVFSKENSFGCGLQNDCFKKSFCVESDGNVYLCAELAAQKAFPIGNWRTEKVFSENISLLKKRTTNVDPECLSCEFYSVCQSGCMAESYAETKSLYNKTYMCESWKPIFHHFKDKYK